MRDRAPVSRALEGDDVTVRTLADSALRRSPAQVVSRKIAARRLSVLAYHGIDDPPQFARQLDVIVRRAQPVSLDAVLAAARGEAELPERAVLITFDDGHRSVLEHAVPLLRERAMPALLFLVVSLLDTDSPFWWSEVDWLVRRGARLPALSGGPAEVVRSLKAYPDAERREAVERLRHSVPQRLIQPQLCSTELRGLESAGIELGNHTSTHPCLDRCEDDVVRDEVRAAHAALTEMVGHPPRAFAYPNGNWDLRAERELERLGYQAAFLFDHRLVRIPPSHPLRLSRVRVSSDTSLDRFITIMSGLHPALHRLRGRS